MAMLKPTQGWAVVRRVAKEAKTQSGLIIQSAGAHDPSRATVAAINLYGNYSLSGASTSDAEGDLAFIIKVGDEVVIRHGTGQAVKHEGEDLALVLITDIIAVV